MTTTTITPEAPHGLPIVADRMPERTVAALLDGAVPLGTTRGVSYLRVGVVLARDEASGTLGIYATEQQWGETTAAALIERETDNQWLRAALAAQENQNAQQAEELARLRAQLAARGAAQPAEPAVGTAKPRAPIPCPDPTCTETRETGQALGRHCQTAHGATLNELRARYAASAIAPDAAQSPAPGSDPDVLPAQEPEKCPECDVTLPPKLLAHHTIEAHGELLTVLRRRQSAADGAAPPQGDT